MNRSIPGPGEMYTDQEGKLYQILCVADHFDTKEKMVVYQALYGAFEFLIRPLGIFMRKMERKRGKEPLQKDKFTVAEENTGVNAGRPQRESRIFQQNQAPSGYPEQELEEERANPALLEFLDADTLEEKYQVIKSLQHSITDRLIDDFAVTLDLVIPDGRLDDRYQQLLSSVRTMQKFETKRFRR